MNMDVVAEIKIVPLGTATTSLSGYVAACLEVVEKAPDIRYELTAMGTVVQGEIGRVLELAREMHEVPFAMGAARVLTTISIDDRRDRPLSIQGKVQAVRGHRRAGTLPGRAE
jgi:uncharacterized protein (TIGR00106 family)